MWRGGHKALLLLLALSFTGVAGRRLQGSSGAATSGGSGFERDVAPILTARCVSCHGPEEQESFLRLDSYAEALKGGLTGSVIVPGDGAGSLLVQHLTGEAAPRMPDGKPPALPRRDRPDHRLDRRRGPRAGGRRQRPPARAPSRHWAYVPPERPDPPAGAGRGLGAEPHRRLRAGPARGGGPRALAGGGPGDARFGA